MGLSLEFYAGDADAIGGAFTECDFDRLQEGGIAHSYADLSLHIPIEDLDVLSEQMAILLGEPFVGFLDSLGRVVGGSEGESGAQVVSPGWIRFAAKVPEIKVGELAKMWIDAASKKAGVEYADPSCAESALLELVRLCGRAIEKKSSVVFAWYL